MSALRPCLALALLAAALCACDASSPPAAGVAATTAGTWRLGTPMNEARSWHSMTVLESGKVLVAGGWDHWDSNSTLTCTASAEIYDPAEDQWQRIAPMLTPRCGHAAIRLDDGRVLVAGGESAVVLGPYFGSDRWFGPAPIASTEIFDPDSGPSGRWTAAAPMQHPRDLGGDPDGRAQTLVGGTVLASGAWFDPIAGSIGTHTELFDPSSATWRPAGQMPLEQWGPTIRLASGRVLAAGGLEGSALTPTAAVSLFDPADGGTWRALPALPGPRAFPSLALLGTGEVLVAGGCPTRWLWPCNPADLALRETILDPETLHTRHPSPMHLRRFRGTTVSLPSRRTLMVAGDAVSFATALVAQPAEIYDPWLDLWLQTPVMPRNVNYGGAIAVLPSGDVLFTGGAVWDGEDATYVNIHTFSISATQIFRE